MNPCHKEKRLFRFLKRVAFSFLVLMISFGESAIAAVETFSTGSLIINMGVTPQTPDNGLLPYGLVYDLIKNQNIAIKWIINPTKIKDGVDFTYNGTSFRGGTFIVPAEFRNASVNATIATWQAKGVITTTTAYPITLDVSTTLGSVPNWALNPRDGNHAKKFFKRADIPKSAYYYRTPPMLNSCDDLFVDPHTDAKWKTHGNLYFWNLNAKGSIWAGGKTAVSMEEVKEFNPLNPSQNLKFLTTGGLMQNAKKGTEPYSYTNVTDPAFQMMGIEDDAHQGHDEIFLPVKTTSAWYPGVKISCYDPTHKDIPSKSAGPAALTVFGRGFDNVNRGYVMYQGGHDIGGTSAQEVSAQREFFNWSMIVAPVKSPGVTYSNIPVILSSSQLYNNFTATPSSPVGLTSFTYKWFSTIGGTFSAINSAVTNYTPPVVASATKAFIYCRITDACGRSTIQPFSVTIVPPSSPPVAINDTIKYANLCGAATRTINVLTNDYDLNGNMVNSITFVGGGNHGTFVNNGNGSVTYTPGWLFQGIDTMRYQVCDNTPLCSQGTLVVNTAYNGICSINQYLRTDTAQADSIEFQQSIGSPNNALGNYDATNGSNTGTAQFNNDNDSIIIRLDATINAGDTVRIRAASDDASCIDFTASGSLTSGGFIPGVNSINFTAPGGAAKIFNYYNFIVTASTRYVKIKIRVTGCNNNLDIDAMRANYRYCTSAVPIAINDVITTGKNAAVTSNVKTNDSDPQNLPLTVSLVSNPTNGTAGINGAGNIVYTPDSGYTGTDQLIYKLSNSRCLSDTAIVTYTVTNNPCSANQIGNFLSGYATGAPSSTNTTNPNEVIGIPDAINGNNALSAIINNVVNANVVLDMTDSIVALDTIVIRMAPDNGLANTITVQGNLTNVWGSPTTSTVFNLPVGTNKIYANYNFIVNAQTRFIRVIQTGTIAAVDVDAASYSFWNCVNKPNRPPVANDDTITTYANRAINKNVVSNDADPDGNSLSISIINPTASNGSGVVAGNTITYTPNFGFTGVDTVTYKLCDAGTPSLCDTGLFIITVDPGPPVAMTDFSSVNSGSPVVVNVQLNDTLAVSAFMYTTSLSPSILSASNGTSILVGNSIQYTPNAGFTGIDSLAYQLCDNDSPAASCDTSKLYITVNNRIPVANADTITTSACNAVILNVISNDTDPENGILTVTSVSVPSNGTAVISNNQIVYTPASSPVFTGIATFTYQVCDNGVTPLCVNGNVSVTVNSNNPPSNPPVAIADIDTTFIGESIPISVLDNDTDPDSDSLKVDSMAVGLLAPSIGTIKYMENNFIQYIPNGTLGVDSFEYKVCDIHNAGAGCVNIVSSCTIAKVYVSILNRAPAANDDQFSTINTFAISNSVAANDDIEPDGQPMTYSLLSNPVFGSVALNADGTFTYTPDGVYVGDEFFDYLVCDNVAPPMCDTARVTISVLTSNVPPNALADTITTYGVTPYTGTVATNDNDPNGNLNPNGFSMLTGPNNGNIIFNTDGSYTYTAYNGFIGSEFVFYEVCDTGNPIMCSYATLNIIVPDSVPVIFNDTLIATEDITLNVIAGVGILSNGDFDPNGTTLTVDTIPLLDPVNGIVDVSPDGSFVYIPGTNFNGTDLFVVNVCDSTSMCTTDTVNIIVNPVNDQVIIINDVNTTSEDTPVNGNIITAGDYDIDTTALKANVVPVVNPTHGGIVIDTLGNYTYTPSADYNGSDMIVFNVCDRGNPLPVTCANDTLLITVNAVNDTPVIDNEMISTNEDTPVIGDFTSGGDFDPDTTVLTTNTIPVVMPLNGSIVVNANGTYTYTPDPNFNGTDTAVVNVCDAGTPLPSICVNDTVIIIVNAVNDTVIISNDILNANEDTPASGSILTAGDYDIDTTALKVNTIPVTGPANGIFTIDTLGAYTYTPSADFFGSDMVVLSVCDRGKPLPATCINDTLFITVNSINDPPVISNDTSEVDEDSTVFGIVINGTDSDVDGTLLRADTIPVSGPSYGTFTINVNGSYQYNPSLNYNGNDVVVVNVCDNGLPLPAICVQDTIFFTVHPINDPPIIVNDTISTNEETLINGNILTAADIDMDTTALVVDTIPIIAPSHGAFIIDSLGAFAYIPFAQFVGVDTVVLSVCDNGRPLPAICINDTLFVIVNPVNDNVIIVNDTISTTEDVAVSGTILTAGDFDPDTTALSVNTTPVYGPNNGVIIMNTNGSYNYTPDPLYNGIDTVVFTVCDSGTPLPSTCDTDTLFITIINVNNPPLIANDIISTNEDEPVNGAVIDGADADPDGSALSANTTPVDGPFHGSILINANGNYTYTPNSNYYGKDTVVISICDSGIPLPAICVNDTLIITINPVNDQPNALTDSAALCSGLNIQVKPLLNDLDIDQDSIFISSIIQPTNGTASTDGVNITYTPAPGFIGSDSIDYTVCDNGLPQLCTSERIYFTVNGITSTGISQTDALCHAGSTGTVSTSPVGNSPFTYLWNTSATTQNITNLTTGFYSVTITDSLGCTRTDTATVQQPLVAVSVGVVISDTKCFGDSSGSANLNVSGGTVPYSYLWSNGNTNQNLLLVPANSYSVIVTDANGCTDTIPAIISQPTILVVNSTITPANCIQNNNGSIDVTVSGGTADYTYSWSNGQAVEDINDIAGTYTLTVTDSNNCIITSVNAINDTSAVLIISSASNNFCAGITTILSSSVNLATFQWFLNGNLIPGATDSIYSTGQQGNYSLLLNHTCGNFTSNILPIVVKPLPVLNISDGDTICEGESTQMTASGASNYLWNPSIDLSNSLISNPFASPLSTTTYTVTGTSVGCSKATTVTITVNPIPVVIASAGNYNCEHGAQLLATGGINYVWSPAIGLDSVNIPNPIATPGVTSLYFVTASNAFMCTSTNSIVVNVDCDIVIIPDGFSPDGDGINDILVIEGIEKFPGNSLSVFNRWGNVIYAKDNYDNSWDAVAMRNGLIIGEGKVPSGTYFYVLDLGDGEKARSGYFIIKY